MSLPVKEILNIGLRQLADSGVDDAAIDSKQLYCFLMGISNAQLILEYQKILPDSLCDAYFKLMDRRASGEPLQYITGVQCFMGLDFDVDENVLIPRQDTETLVEDAMEIIRNNTLRGQSLPIRKRRDWEVLDLCCGSGAIGISLASLCPGVNSVVCSDISKGALSVARRNASKLGVSKKVDFEEGSLLKPFKGRFKNKRFDMIISNPPYIKTSVIATLQREVRDHEPMMALDGGIGGLDFYKGILEDAAGCLKKDGVLMLEIGHDQREDVCSLITQTERFDHVTALQDLAGRDRIVAAVLRGKK